MRYFPELNPNTGSINGTIFFLQVLYWYQEQKKPFYKFQKASTHILYKPGDSWGEELGFTDSQLKSVLAKTATKLRKGGKYDLGECELVLYWNVGNGLNYYCPNYPAMLSLGDATTFLERKFPHFEKWKSDFSKVGKDLFEITFSHPRKFDIAIPYLQKITQSNTINYPEREPPSNFILNEKNQVAKTDAVILPHETMRFKEIWKALKEYKLSDHNFVFTPKNEQAALMPLAKYDEEYAIQLIQTAIANKWKNFHFEDTPRKFLNHKNSIKYGKFTKISKGDPNPHVAEVFKKYSK